MIISRAEVVVWNMCPGEQCIFFLWALWHFCHSFWFWLTAQRRRTYFMEIFFSSPLSQTELSGLLSERLSTSLPERKTEFLTAVTLKRGFTPKYECSAAIYSAFFLACENKAGKSYSFPCHENHYGPHMFIVWKKQLGHSTKHFILYSTKKGLEQCGWINDDRTII